MTESRIGALTAALSYAGRGWHVYPIHSVQGGRCTCGMQNCGSPGKHPRTTHGHKDATTTEATIVAWFQRWPWANVGVAAGAQSDLLVVDVDPRNDGDGTLAELESQYGPLPHTVEVVTGGGGRHFYFSYPTTEVRNSTLGPGVEVKVNGGVVAPPSLHASGQRYRWEVSSHPDSVPVAPPPDWLLSRLTRADSGPTERFTCDLIPQGERNNTLTSLAGTMRQRGITEREIEAALKETNRGRCAPPISDDEVRRIARSVARYKPGDQPAGDRSDLPEIRANDGDLARVTEAAWAALVAANEPPFVFRHGGVATRMETGDDGAPILQPVNRDMMRHILARTIRWFKESNGTHHHALPPEHVVRDVLATPDMELPVLARIVEAPVFAKDGTLQTEPGYHQAGRVFYRPHDGLPIPNVPEEPSELDVTRARGLILEELLGDFPFTGDAERANSVALLLLPFVRDLIDGATPLHLIEKPLPGTGASLLADVLTHPATGRPVTAMTEGRDEDEWRKRITARLLDGPTVVLIDNLRQRLTSSALSAAITAGTWEDRLLGHSRMVRIQVNCAWIATGNNPSLSAEIARRTVRIRLDPKVDQPWLRGDFRHADLREWAKKNRGEIVWAALTLVRAWQKEGSPQDTHVRLGMFESWSRIIGGILKVAEIPGFLSNLNEFYELSDAEGSMLKAFVLAWWDRFEGKEVGVAQLWNLANSDDTPLDLGNGNERSQKIVLGKSIAGIRDRRFAHLRVIFAGTHQRSNRWRLSSDDGTNSE